MMIDNLIRGYKERPQLTGIYILIAVLAVFLCTAIEYIKNKKTMSGIQFVIRDRLKNLGIEKHNAEGIITDVKKSIGYIMPFYGVMTGILSLVVIPILVGYVTNDSVAVMKQHEETNYYIEDASEYYDNGNYADAQYYYEKALEISPDNRVALKGIVDSLYKQKKYSDAIEQCDNLLTLSPDDAIYHNLYGMICYSNCNYEDAYEHQKRALELRPDILVYSSNIVMDLEQLHRYDEAVALCETLVRERPDNSVYNYHYAYVLTQMEKYEDALKYMKKAESLNSDDDTYTKYVGLIGNLIELNRDKNDPEKHNDVGNSYYWLREYKKALDEYTIAGELDDKNYNYQGNAAYALYQLGRYSEAVDRINESLDINPNQWRSIQFRELLVMLRDKDGDNSNTEEMLDMTTLYFKMGWYKDAATLLNELEESNPMDENIESYRSIVDYITATDSKDSAESKYRIGVFAYNIREDYEWARREFDSCCQQEPDNADAHNYLGLCYYSLGEKYYNESLEEFERAHELMPDEKTYSDNIDIMKENLGIT